MACEDRFKLDIPDDDWDGLRTIHQIVAYIDRMKTQ
jgi:acyl carrier protein